MQNDITIYSKDYCPYCQRAIALLTSKGVDFTNHEIANNAERTAEMLKRSGGRRTVPQIFIGDVHVGGSDDLFMLERAGKLDELLGLATIAA
jgi:glutaredoxin 3